MQEETTVETAAVETATEASENATPEIVEVPARVALKIGQRTRYFATKEEALAALEAFKNKAAKGPGKTRRVLTAEQKAELAKKREPLMAYAATQGLEGKKAAMLANVLEELCENVEGVHALIVEYVAANPVEAKTDVAPEDQADPSADPLAEFM